MKIDEAVYELEKRVGALEDGLRDTDGERRRRGEPIPAVESITLGDLETPTHGRTSRTPDIVDWPSPNADIVAARRRFAALEALVRDLAGFGPNDFSMHDLIDRARELQP